MSRKKLSSCFSLKNCLHCSTKMGCKISYESSLCQWSQAYPAFSSLITHKMCLSLSIDPWWLGERSTRSSVTGWIVHHANTQSHPWSYFAITVKAPQFVSLFSGFLFFCSIRHPRDGCVHLAISNICLVAVFPKILIDSQVSLSWHLQGKQD